MMATRGFYEQVTLGNRYVSERQWRDILKRAFPTTAELIYVSDEKSNRRGSDWVLEHADGHFTRVQTKAQSPRYDDFVIEYLANDSTNTPGWVNLELNADFIAYAIPKRRLVYFIPWPMLKEAWKQHGTTWIQKAELRVFGFRMSKVRQTWGGVTHSVVVPVEALCQDLGLPSLWAVPMEAGND